MKTLKVQVKDLKPCDEIIEIRPVNVLIVSQYRQHMRAGAEFPKIVTVKKGRHYQIVSGHHRHAAILAEYGEDHWIEILVEDFDSLADMIEYAVAQNVAHGLPLDGISKKRAIHKLTELGRTPEQLATLLGVSVKRIEVWSGESVLVLNPETEKREIVPVKSGLDNMHNKVVSAKAYEQHIQSDMGIPAKRNAEQLTRWIKNGWVDLEDEATLEAMRKLAEALEKLLCVA